VSRELEVTEYRVYDIINAIYEAKSFDFTPDVFFVSV
jgi:hypothetical protein